MKEFSNDPSSPAGFASAADGLIHRLSLRYLFVLAAVASLVVVDQALIQPWLSYVNSYAPTINLAGRQRMLSQKLTKAALALGATEDQAEQEAWREQLQLTLNQWNLAHAALSEGDDHQGVVRFNTPEMLSEAALMEPHYQQMSAAASAIAHRNARNLDDSNTSDAAYTRTILAHEAGYLASMDRLVKLFEGEAALTVDRLRTCALTIALAVVALLVGLGWYVVLPATGAIRVQVEGLETRVAERTKELATTNDALEHEIMERELAESRTQRLAAQLAHASRVSTMGHLTAGLAHELNQPLAAIVNYAGACDIALGQSDRPDLRRNLEQVGQAAMRAGQIVRRIRDFVRPQAGAPSDCDLHALVREVAELCRTELERHEVCLMLELEASGSHVSVDAIQIQQVLVNLIQNAVQAMQDCPAHSRFITIRTANCPQGVQVSVADAGPGLSAETRAQLFAPFQTTKSDGLGIGLSICRSIIERHEGRIWADASTELGATFVFTLPPCSRPDVSARESADCFCR